MSQIELKNLKPRDLIVISPNTKENIIKGHQPAHVGLNIGGILGSEAESAFGRYRLYIRKGRTFKPHLAVAARNRFIEIAGFSPNDVLEEVSEIELSLGFTTL